MVNSSKANVYSVGGATAKILNAIVYPVRTASNWRKVWTNYRGRLKKKISANITSIRQTGGGPAEYSKLTATENSIGRIVNTSIAANPSSIAFKLNIPQNRRNDISPQAGLFSTPLVKVSPSSLVGVSCSAPAETFSSLESENAVLEVATTNVQALAPNNLKEQTDHSKKNRLETKGEERNKLVKLVEKQIEEKVKMNLAWQKLAAV